eukprot:gene16263-biopygen2235
MIASDLGNPALAPLIEPSRTRSGPQMIRMGAGRSLAFQRVSGHPYVHSRRPVGGNGGGEGQHHVNASA